MNPDDELLDAILHELDRQALVRRAADYVERGGTLRHRWAADRLRAAADDPAWRDDSPSS